MKKDKVPLFPEEFYHIYNRANGNELCFTERRNYGFFLEKYWKYTSPIADTFSYCLMPNHFHFLVRIKSEKEVLAVMLKKMEKSFSKTLQGFQTLEGLKRSQAISRFLSLQFSHLFNAYSQAFNKQEDRKGSLFMHPYKRKHIHDESYLMRLIHYIHFNPVEAGLCIELDEWEFSSYGDILSGETTQLKREKVLEWFEGKEDFIQYHKREPEIDGW